MDILAGIPITVIQAITILASTMPRLIMLTLIDPIAIGGRTLIKIETAQIMSKASLMIVVKKKSLHICKNKMNTFLLMTNVIFTSVVCSSNCEKKSKCQTVYNWFKCRCVVVGTCDAIFVTRATNLNI